MKSSTFSAFSRVVAPAAVALSLLAAAACTKGGSEGPGTGAASSDFKLSVVVNAPDAAGKRTASARFETSQLPREGQLSFELPAECRILAGAAVRPVKPTPQGTLAPQELAFECTAGVTGQLKVTFKGVDAAGQPLERSAEGAL